MSGVGTQWNLRLNPNTANPFARLWVDGNRNPIDFTGSTFKLEVKARDANGDPTGSVLLSLETGSGISGAVADGEFDVIFPKYVESPLAGLPVGDYVYDVLRLVSGVAVEPMCWGFIDVDEAVTTE